MTQPTQDAMENAVVTLQYTLRNINELINLLNRPATSPVMALANFINDIHLQIAPQIEKMNEEDKDVGAA
jgi:hypothetical protein